MAKTEERDAVRQALDYFLNEWLEQIVVSGPRLQPLRLGCASVRHR